MNKVIANVASELKEGIVPKGSIWVMSKRKVERFEGEFKDYKKLVLKKLITEDITV